MAIKKREYSEYDVRRFGAKGDGVTDDTAAIRAALAANNIATLAPGVYRVTDTIQVGTRGKTLYTMIENIRDYGARAILKYDGPVDNRKAVVQLGGNSVGAEPTIDGTANTLKGVIVDANYKAGFAVYGTYLTNDTIVERVTGQNALEYNMYFARGWYATLRDLISLGGLGQGLAFGMPLEYLDGTSVSWVTAAPLELNNCQIENIRAHGAGRHFSVDNPGTFNPTLATMRRKGYGIGAGIGNSFMMDTYTSEQNGGVGLYVYNEMQPMKTIKTGYLEANCKNSGLDPATTMPNIIIENVSADGGPIFIDDVFANYQSGGIYHTGVLGRKVWLRNVQQPRFLKSLDGLSPLQLYAEVLKQNVYYMCGYLNTLQALANSTLATQTVNTRYSFTVTAPEHVGQQVVFVKGDGTVPWGSFLVTFADGTNTAVSFPTGLGTSYVPAYQSGKGIVSITKSGGTGGTDSNVTFKIMNTPATYL